MRRGLVEYLKEGWQMEVHVGIDFTLSNIEITDFRSLHRQGDTGVMNQYEKAIVPCITVVRDFGGGAIDDPGARVEVHLSRADGL